MCSEWFSKDALYVMDVLGRVGVSTLMLALSKDKIFFYLVFIGHVAHRRVILHSSLRQT